MVDPTLINVRSHGELRGLQVADVLASSLGAALNPHKTSKMTEHRYVKQIVRRYFRYDDRVLSHGLKLWPSQWTELGLAFPDDLRQLIGLEIGEGV